MAGAIIKNNNKRLKIFTPYLLLLPAFLFYILFWIKPVLDGTIEVFTDLNGKLTLSNFVNMWNSELFPQALLFTLLFALVSVVFQYVLALGLSVLISKRFIGSKLLMFIAMIPMAIPPTAVAILWKTGMLKDGWINSILMSLNITDTQISFLSFSGIPALLLIILIDTWTVTPSVMIILVAGLQGLQKEFSEAACVFGANKWQVLKDITIPILKPSIITSIILRLIAALQVWAIAVMVFGFGRIPFLVERVAFYVEVVHGRDDSTKLAFTISFITTVLVFVVTLVYFKVARRNTVIEKGGK